MEKYNFLSIDGSEIIPTYDYVIEMKRKEIVTCVQLDSNICLDLVSFIKNRHTLPQKTLEKIQHLLDVLRESRCDVHIAFSLYELSMNKNNLQIDMEKIQRLTSQIWTALDLCLRDIFSPKYTAEDLGINRVNAFSNLEPMKAIMDFFYASFLKIILIAEESGLKKEKAVANSIQFLKWLDEVIDVCSSFVIQPALAIFGGDSIARKFLGIGAKRNFRDSAWGATCDAWLIYMAHRGNSYPQNCIFVTNDLAMFSIFSRSFLQKSSFPSNDFPQYSIDYDYPHFENNNSVEEWEIAFDSIYHRRKERISCGTISRKPPEIDLVSLISELEREIEMVQSQK